MRENIFFITIYFIVFLIRIIYGTANNCRTLKFFILKELFFNLLHKIFTSLEKCEKIAQETSDPHERYLPTRDHLNN